MSDGSPRRLHAMRSIAVSSGFGRSSRSERRIPEAAPFPHEISEFEGQSGPKDDFCRHRAVIIVRNADSAGSET